MWADIVYALGESKDAYMAVFAAVGCYVSIVGLSTWRRQLKGRSEYELARRFCKTLFVLREELNAMRSPFMLGSEMIHAVHEMYEKEEAEKLIAASSKDTTELTFCAYRMRWRRVQEKFTDFLQESIEAEILWGENITPEIEAVNQRVREIGSAMDCYIIFSRDDESGVESIDYRKIFLRGIKDESTFDKQLQGAIEEAQKKMKPHLRIR